MGKLVEGVWHDVWYQTEKHNGRYERQDSLFRNWVTTDGSAGPSGESGYKAEAGRYHLYVSLACPWAHRTIIMRKLKGLEDMISMSVVNSLMGPGGWTFDAGPGVIPDNINHTNRLYEIYTKAAPACSSRVTVPVLWDKHNATIVSNESSDIIRILNNAFDQSGASPSNFYPKGLRAEIDNLNSFIYSSINNGVYRAGFAGTQEAYDEAVTSLFDALDQLEERLASKRYLTGNTITEADWRLFTTLIRFDPVYFGHFKCNIRRLIDYPNLWGYTKDLYQVPGIAETVDIDHIKAHYYASHTHINPAAVVPQGPKLDYSTPHGRENTGNLAV